MKRGKAVLCLFAIALPLCGGAAMAQEKPLPPVTYASPDEIPDALLRFLQRGDIFREELINNGVLAVRRAAADNEKITPQDIKRAADAQKVMQRAAALRDIIVYDENLDGRITQAEIVNFLHQQAAQQMAMRGSARREDLRSAQVKKIMEADLDGDGVITLREAVESFQARPARSEENNAALLALDIDGDGAFSVHEISHLLQAASLQLDKNGDGRLTREELEPLTQRERNRREAKALADSLAKCKIPPPDAADKIFTLNIQGGLSVSSAAVGAQDVLTTAAGIMVEQGASPLYLMLSAESPMVWDIKGETKRIARLVVLGSAKGPQQTEVLAGVRGVPADKITFLQSRDCRGVYRAAPDRSMGRVFEMLFGRKPDGDASPRRGSIFDAVISDTQISARDKWPADLLEKAPKGFDAGVWKDMVTLQSQYALLQIPAAEVVSLAEVRPYDVLPAGFGLAALVHDGTLEAIRTKRGAYIVRAWGPEEKALRLPDMVTIENNASIFVQQDQTEEEKARGLPPEVTLEPKEQQAVFIPYYDFRVKRALPRFPMMQPALVGDYSRFLVPADMPVPALPRDMGACSNDGDMRVFSASCRGKP